MDKKTQTAERQRLIADCQLFIERANQLSEEQFRQQSGGKWSMVEVMQHLYLSARPVTGLLTGPHDVLAHWPVAEAPSRTYEEVVVAYGQVLATGWKAPDMSVPRPDDMQVDRRTIVEQFTGIYQTLIDAADNWSEQELDKHTLPHLALGKVTIREMLHFISAHTQHHLALLPKV